MSIVDSKASSTELIIMKRYRWTSIAASLLAGLLGGWVGSIVRAPVHAAEHNIYRAEGFELVGPDGQVAAVLGFDHLNEPSPTPRLIILNKGRQSVLLEANYAGGNLTLKNHVDGKSQIVLGNGAVALTTDHPTRSSSWIQIYGRNADIVWSAP
jgi:hypothetical protein